MYYCSKCIFAACRNYYLLFVILFNYHFLQQTNTLTSCFTNFFLDLCNIFLGHNYFGWRRGLYSFIAAFFWIQRVAVIADDPTSWLLHENWSSRINLPFLTNTNLLLWSMCLPGQKNCFLVMLVFEATDNSYETLFSMEINILSGDDIFIFIYYIITVHTNHSMVPSAQCSMHSLQTKCDFCSSYRIEPMTVMQWAGPPTLSMMCYSKQLKSRAEF